MDVVSRSAVCVLGADEDEGADARMVSAEGGIGWMDAKALRELHRMRNLKCEMRKLRDNARVAEARALASLLSNNFHFEKSLTQRRQGSSPVSTLTLSIKLYCDPIRAQFRQRDTQRDGQASHSLVQVTDASSVRRPRQRLMVHFSILSVAW